MLSLKHVVAALVGIFFLSAQACLAGPFGTNMGDKKEQYKNLTPAGDDAYMTRDVPLPHSAFEEYHLFFGESGLNAVAARSVYKNDKFGTSAQNEYIKIKKQLISKYGEPETKEFLRDGALYKEDAYFVASLYKSERLHGALWEFKKAKDGVKKITLFLAGESFSQCSLIIRYEYENRKEAEEKKASHENNAL